MLDGIKTIRADPQAERGPAHLADETNFVLANRDTGYNRPAYAIAELTLGYALICWRSLRRAAGQRRAE